MHHSPMDQFKIEVLFPLHVGGFDLSFTNSSLWMVIATVVAGLLFTVSTRRMALVPTRLQSLAEVSYEFIANMIRDTIGSEGQRFFPLVFTLFIFVLLANLLGLIPHSFTTTSHISVTFALAALVITIVLGYGFYRNGLKFLKLFAPSGVPWWLIWLIVLIEIISFLSRPVSLSVRLFANMLAGHTMLKVFAMFITGMLGAGGVVAIGAIGPLFAATAITALEFLIAFLQAYVFAILTCIYLNDTIHFEH